MTKILVAAVQISSKLFDYKSTLTVFTENLLALKKLGVDLADITRGKFDLDVSGHYGRPDVFNLAVNTAKQTQITLVDDKE